jgi:hypothetical protein
MWRWEDVKMRRCFTDPHYWKNPALRRSREKSQEVCCSEPLRNQLCSMKILKPAFKVSTRKRYCSWKASACSWSGSFASNHFAATWSFGMFTEFTLCHPALGTPFSWSQAQQLDSMRTWDENPSSIRQCWVASSSCIDQLNPVRIICICD